MIPSLTPAPDKRGSLNSKISEIFGKEVDEEESIKSI
jgi:hypothetical protein